MKAIPVILLLLLLGLRPRGADLGRVLAERQEGRARPGPGTRLELQAPLRT